jgi:multidrug efflux pump subunit AcrA (membrane-fusion protein)
MVFIREIFNMTEEKFEAEDSVDEGSELQEDTAAEEAKPKHRLFSFGKKNSGGGTGRKGKKLWIWLIVIALAAGGCWGYFKYSAAKKAAASASANTYVRTVTLTKGSLENTVTADGTIASQDTSNVTTELKYTVKTINVAVGDTVQAGDTIITLDTTDLEDQIKRKEEQDEESLEKLQKAVTDASYSKDDAYNTMADAKTALTEANDAEDDAYDAYNKAFKEVNSYLTEADNKAAALVTATDALNGKNAACVAAGLGSQCANEITTASPCGTSTLSKTAQEYCDAESAYESAQSDSVTAQKASSDVQSSVNYTTLEKAYSEAKATAEKAQTTYDDAAKKFNTVNANYFDAVDALNKGVTDDDLEDLKTDLANCTLKAETGGTVTAINATVGSAASGTVATISNTSALQITVSVDEYDIQSIQKGMKATISSDAIDSTLNGTVTTVSPVATTSNSGQSSSSFSVVVTIDGETDALLIGMSAEVKIILSSTGDVYTVPIDAVGTDDSGNSVIYVKNDSGEFEPVVVTTGDSNDYYIEVSGDSLSEGMTVRASADENAAAVATASASASSDSALNFNMGGSSSGGDMSGGGGAPSGGGGGAPSGGGPGGN